MAEEKLNIFSDPDKIDAMINQKLAILPSTDIKGPKSNSKRSAWTEEEIALRDAVILQYICEQGFSREQTAQQLVARWNASLGTIRRYIKDAIQRFITNIPPEMIEEQRRIWLERCETILQKALEDNTKDSALKALDLYAKAVGMYPKESKEVTVNGNMDIKFDFS